MHLAKAFALFALPVIAAPGLTHLDDPTESTMELHTRGTENCNQEGVKWKPNNGKVIQTIDNVCKTKFAGEWKPNETHQHCRKITTENMNPFQPPKKMILEIGNRKGHSAYLKHEDCKKYLRTMFDECIRGGWYTNKYGWYIKADPDRGTC